MAFISNIFVILAVATVTFATPTLRYKREGQAASSSASSPLDSFTQNIPSGLSGANSPVNYEQYIQQLSSLSGQFPTGSLPAVGSLPTFGQSSTRRKREESAAAASNPLQGFTQNIPSQFSGANSPVPYEQYIQQLSSLSGQFPTGSLPAVGSLPTFGQSSITRRKREESAAAASNPLQGFTQNIPSQFSGANSPVPYEQYIQQLSSLSGQFPTGSLPAVGSLPTFGQSSTRRKREESAAAASNPLQGFTQNIPSQFSGANSPVPYEQYIQQLSSLSGQFPTGSLPAVGSLPTFGQSSTRRKREESAAAASNPLQGFTQNIPSQFSGANSPVPYEQYIQQLSSLSGQFPTGSLPAVGSLPTFGQSSTRRKREESAAAASNPLQGFTQNIPSQFSGANSPVPYEQYIQQLSSLSGQFPTGSLPAVGSLPTFGQSSTRRKREESAAAASNPLQGFTQNIPSQFSGANSPVPYEQYIQQLSSLSGQFPTGSLPAVGSLPTFGQSSTRKGKDDSAAASPSSNPFAELFTPEQIEQYMNSFQQFSGSFPTGSLPAANFPSFGSASTSS